MSQLGGIFIQPEGQLEIRKSSHGTGSEGGFEPIECSLALWHPPEGNVLPGEDMEWGDNVGKGSHKPPVIGGQSQKRAYLRGCGGRGDILNGTE